MHIIDSPTEQTTAATDVILAAVSLVFSFLLVRIGRKTDLRKGSVWAAALGLLGLAAGLGSIAHGLSWSPEVIWLLWQPLNLSLGLAISLFVVGVVYDLRRQSLPRYFLAGMLGVGVAFYSVTVLVPGSFLVFIIYEALAMLFALGAYLWLIRRKHFAGAGWMAAGIAVTMLAAGIQASKAFHFTLIWEFDSNGLFHLVQIPGVIFIFIGVSNELIFRKNRHFSR